MLSCVLLGCDGVLFFCQSELLLCSCIAVSSCFVHFLTAHRGAHTLQQLFCQMVLTLPAVIERATAKSSPLPTPTMVIQLEPWMEWIHPPSNPQLPALTPTPNPDP